MRVVLLAYERSISMPHTIALLIAGVGIGVAVYAITAGVLWVIAGRLVGAARLVLDRIREALKEG